MTTTLERRSKALRPWWALAALVCACALSPARAQATLNYEALSDTATLTFNPTASLSPYPFRTSTPGGGGDGSCTPDPLVPTRDLPGDPEYLRCFKNFPQFFNPLTPFNNPAAPSTGGYDLVVRNCTANPYNLRIDFSPTSPITRIPLSRIQYTIDNGTTWTNASGTLTTIQSFPPDASPGCTVADDVTVNVRFRLRLRGNEFADPGAIISDITFRLQVGGP